MPDAGPGARRRPRLLNRNFAHLWYAETISQLGSQVSLLALPLVAISVLHATTFEVGALTAAEMAPFVLFGLPAGVIVDRLPRRPILMAADLGRALALATVPVAYGFGVLSYAQLVAVVFVTGSLTVFFDVSYQSILPALVERDEIVEGNSRLEVSRSSAQLAGPAGAGLLIDAIGAASAVTADAASFVASALFISRMHAREEPLRRTADGTTRLRALGRDIKEGLGYVVHHPVLRMISGSTATSNLFSSMTTAVFLLYAVRERHYSAGLVGLVFFIGNTGPLVAAFVADRIARTLRLGRTIWLSMLVCCLGGLGLGLAPTRHPFAYFAGAWLLLGFGSTVYNISQVSLRQAITPHQLQGRMNASVRFIVWGTMPFGSLLGGALGAAIGLRPTLIAAGAGALLAVPWVLARPVRELVEIPPVDVALAD